MGVRFELTQRAFIHGGLREEGEIVELDCTKGKDGEWEGPEIPSKRYMKEYKGSKETAKKAPPVKKPVQNP